MQILKLRQQQSTDRNRKRMEQEAIVTDVSRQGREWRVRYQGTFWTAYCTLPDMEFYPGDRVYVVGRQNIALMILPMTQ